MTPKDSLHEAYAGPNAIASSMGARNVAAGGMEFRELVDSIHRT